MFERLKEWFSSFKNKVTTAMTFIGGLAATAALLPLPIPTWARIGLGVVAAAAPVVSVVHATAEFSKSHKAETKPENLVEALTTSASDETVKSNPEIAKEKAALVDSLTDNARACTESEVSESNTVEINEDQEEVVRVLIYDEKPESETGEALEAIQDVMEGNPVTMTNEQLIAASETIVDTSFPKEKNSEERKNVQLKVKSKGGYGRSFENRKLANLAALSRNKSNLDLMQLVNATSIKRGLAF